MAAAVLTAALASTPIKDNKEKLPFEAVFQGEPSAWSHGSSSCYTRGNACSVLLKMVEKINSELMLFGFSPFSPWNYKSLQLISY